MKSIYRFNLIIYLIVVGLYIYEPVSGALGQFGLGIFQLIFAIKMSLEKNNYSTLVIKHINTYWWSILFWIFSTIIIFVLFDYENFGEILLFVCPMLIGLYFVIITYLTQKQSLYENSNSRNAFCEYTKCFEFLNTQFLS